MPMLVKKAESSVLRQFAFHGMHLEDRSNDQATGECLFCGRDGKFGVKVSTGEWRCYVCDASGNVLTFMRELWRLSDERTNGESNVLATDRRLLYPETPTKWGCAVSVLTGQWLLPGYDAEMRLVQLYKYAEGTDGKRRLLPTPGFEHGLHVMGVWDAKKDKVEVFEGPWDGMAAGEVMRVSKWEDGVDGGRLVATGNELMSLFAESNVCAVPGCGSIGEPFRRWLKLFDGKDVTLWFDNDHPTTNRVTGAVNEPAGLSAMRRATVLLSQGDHQARSVGYHNWSGKGTVATHNAALPGGYDVRDDLSLGEAAHDRMRRLEALLKNVEPVPDDWTRGKRRSGSASSSSNVGPDLTSLHCTDWIALTDAWRKAMRWRQELDDVFSVMLAVALSTNQVGDQLFLQVIGDAGSGKTRMCDGMLVSKHCFALEHLTGFHSGWKDGSGEDFSLLSRINHKTLITPEGDVLMSSPKFIEIMSQQRRIFDGTSGASYKNSKEDLRYTGLRTPWIMAGTPALMNTDQSRLGDRFLRVCINPPTDEERRAILESVAYTAMDAMLAESDGHAESHIEERQCLAYRLTGGYVDYLRMNSTELIASVVIEDRAALAAKVGRLAEFAACLRARPDPDPRKESTDTKELPTRLTHQFIRLARCLAAVLNRRSVDEEVMRRLKKVVMDTSRGRTLDALRHVQAFGDRGITPQQLCLRTHYSEDKDRAMLTFLRRIKVVEAYEPTAGGLRMNARWRLMPWMRELWSEVMTVKRV